MYNLKKKSQHTELSLDFEASGINCLQGTGEHTEGLGLQNIRIHRKKKKVIQVECYLFMTK
jgi:hypothetical protein